MAHPKPERVRRRACTGAGGRGNGWAACMSEVTRPPNEQDLSGRHTAAQRAAVPVRWSVWLGASLTRLAPVSRLRPEELDRVRGLEASGPREVLPQARTHACQPSPQSG